VEAPVRFVSFEPLTGPTINIPGWADWIIIGAMTGPGAIKPKPQWVQGLMDEADKNSVPVFLKDNLHWPEVRQEWPKGA
jgi:protein gp37